MEAREFLDAARDAKLILRLAAYNDDKCIGRGQALVLDLENRIAIMLENCGDPTVSGVSAGYIVNYVQHPEAEPRISGSTATISP